MKAKKQLNARVEEGVKDTIKKAAGITGLKVQDVVGSLILVALGSKDPLAKAMTQKINEAVGMLKREGIEIPFNLAVENC